MTVEAWDITAGNQYPEFTQKSLWSTCGTLPLLEPCFVRREKKSKTPREIIQVGESLIPSLTLRSVMEGLI